MKILITGAAGFIGFKFSEYLLKKNFNIFEIYNLNNYYDIKLKRKRLQKLKKYKKFKFKKIDLINNKKIEIVFKKNKFDFVFHFAAQAGVRYALESPREYINSNINGFFNILEISKKYKVNRIFISSSSSVYGDNSNYPSKENLHLNPNNVYSLSKKFNEDLSKSYSNFYNLNVTALRFFTVYGEWGRPDMLIMKIMKSVNDKKTFFLNNHGDHYRDFTYINDVTKILYKLFKKKNQKKFEIFNICGNKPIKVQKIVNKLESLVGNIKIKNIEKNKADVYKTHGSNGRLIKYIGKFNFTPVDVGLRNVVDWYEKYYKK